MMQDIIDFQRRKNGLLTNVYTYIYLITAFLQVTGFAKFYN